VKQASVRAQTIRTPPQPESRKAGNGQPEDSAPDHAAPAVDCAVAESSPDAAVDAISNRQLFFWMFRFLRTVPLQVVFACVWLAAGVGTEVYTTHTTGDAVNRIKELHQTGRVESFRQWLHTTEPSGMALRHAIVVLAILVALLICFRYLRIVAESKMSMNMVYFIREAVYDKLQRVGFGFHDAISTGQLINRALTDLQNVRSFIQTAILATLDIVLIVGGYIILIAFLNRWLAVLSVLPLPIWTFYILRFSRRVQPVAKTVMEAGDRNVQIITENIAGVHVIKAFATEKQEIAKYSGNCDMFKQRVLRRIRMFADFQPVVRSIAMGSHLLLFLTASILMIRGRLEAGAIVVLGNAMGAILGRLQQVATINEQYQNAIVSSRRLYEVLAAPPTVKEKPDAKPLPPGDGSMTFENVTFGYDAEKPVIKDVSFSAPGGAIVALVGPTGAGKTTLVNLIARFYDPQQGRITIDGVDLRDVSLPSLRSQVAFVFQETYLFSDTVAANIAYGRPRVLDAEGRVLPGRGEIEAAARLAQAHDFIQELPKGYDTVLTERGSSLSGGQRQRLAIARAILTDPRILVLDDATAAIDPETEDMIRKAMNVMLKGRTTFVIAHRISTVKQADLVIVLEHGRVAQTGKHDDLMNQPGHYQEIAAAQLYGDDERLPNQELKPSHMDRVQDPDKIAAEQATLPLVDPEVGVDNV
jgi:ATP-binding cassette subfamily B protein